MLRFDLTQFQIHLSLIKATIVGLDNNTLAYTVGTRYNLLSNLKFKVDNKINNAPFTVSEKSQVSASSFLILILRSNFKITQMELWSEYSSIIDDNYFFFPVYIQERLITMTDLHIGVSGRILRTYDPANFYIENISIDYYRNLAGMNFYASWNYPEAYLNDLIFVNNITFYYSQTRAIRSSIFGALIHDGEGDLVVTNYVSTVYFRSVEPYASIGIRSVGQWSVDLSDKIRYFNLTNAEFTLDDKNFGERHNVVVSLLDKNFNRIIKIYYTNIDVSKCIGSSYPPIFALNHPLGEVYETNTYVTNSSSYWAVAAYIGLKKVVISDLYLEKSGTTLQYIYEVIQVSEIEINNVTINNMIIDSASSEGIFYLETLNDGSVCVTNFTLLNSYLGSKHGFDYASSTSGNLKLNNIHFENVTVDSGVVLIRAEKLSNLELRNATFKRISQINPIDSSNKMISISTLDLNTTGTFSIDQVTATEWSIGMFEMQNIINAENSTRTLQLNDITYTNSVFEYSNDLILVEHIETSEQFQIIISSVRMVNLTFPRNGHLFKLGHQTDLPFIIKNWYFNQIYGGTIYIESVDLQNSALLTKVEMSNITAKTISSGIGSFIMNNEGGYLSIFNSNFTYLDNIERGSVINGGYQNSITLVYNTTFKNNFSIYGGVANVGHRSVIKFYDWTLSNNFAIQSGVIQSSNEGSYEFHSCILTSNSAYTLPISEIFVVSIPSVISNWSIFSNIIISQSQIVNSLSYCTPLWFSENYKKYLSKNPELLTMKISQYLMQCISASFKIDNNTVVTNQAYFLSSYLSTVTIQNSTFENIRANDSILQVTNSKLTLSEVLLKNLTTQGSAVFVQVSFESELFINDFSFIDSGLDLIIAQSSQIQISNAHIENVSIACNKTFTFEQNFS